MGQYRGNVDDFLNNVGVYEDYLDGNGDVGDRSQLIAGKCTPKGTLDFLEDATKNKGIPKRNFRRPLLADEKEFYLSTIGLGTYLGLPDDATDFDVYNAAKHLILSGGVNVLDTAINYRCQKAERALGAALRTLVHKHKVNREGIFVCSKNGYIPDDADNGVSKDMLIQQLVEDQIVSPSPILTLY